MNDLMRLEKADVEVVSCTCCGSSSHIPSFRGDRHGFGLTTVVCADCGLVFTNPRPIPSWFAEFYRLHYRMAYRSIRVPDESYLAQDWISGRHRRNVELLGQFIPSKGSMLDVGCAEGTFLHFFRERFPDWNVQGIEPSEDFSEFARRHYGLKSVTTGLLEDLSQRYRGEEFDLITISHVLEHLLDPNHFFSEARRLLKTDGLLFVDVPDAEGESRGPGNVHIAHLYHYSTLSLSNFFQKHGFKRIHVRKGADIPSPWTLQMIGCKMESIPQSWSPVQADSRKLARAFARHCSLPLLQSLRSSVARAKNWLQTLKGRNSHTTYSGK